MSFLDSQPDLSNTIFTKNDLQKAREYLFSVITREDPAWLKNPQGQLGEYWSKDSEYGVCFLIDIAQMIFALERKITQRSIPLLYTKVKGLLRPASKQQFFENLTELQAAWMLVGYASPLDVDPMVSTNELLSSSNRPRPRTPDFALRLPDGDVFLEVTVFHIEILDAWETSIDYITTAIKRHLRKQHRDLLIHFQLPLPFLGDTDQMINLVISEIDRSDSGHMSIGGNGTIRWEPLPTLAIQDFSSVFSAFSDISSPAAVFSTPGGRVGRAFAQLRSIATMPEEDVNKANELLFNSLRNTLKSKRKQFRHEKPYLLVIRPGHHRLLNDELVAKIQQRIWPNKDYEWITGIVLFIPRQAFSKSDVEHQMKLCPNPNARYKASGSLISLFNGTVQSHTDER